MKKDNEHSIEKQEIILNLRGDFEENDLKSIQENIVKLYKKNLGAQLDKIFSSLVPEDIVVNIERIEIMLPEIDLADLSNLDEISKSYQRNFDKIARKIIVSKLSKIAGTKMSNKTNAKNVISKWHIIEKFMEDGHYPVLLSTQNESIEKIFGDLFQESASKMAEIINKLSRRNRSKIIDRLVYQFNEKNLNKIIVTLYNKNGKDALRIIENIRRRLGNRYQALKGQKPVNKAIMTAALEFVLRQSSKGQSLKFSEREFTQFIVEAIQKKYRHVEEDDLTTETPGVKNEFSSRYADLDIIEYFLLNGSVPFWASTESQQSVQQLFVRLSLKKLSALQRIIAKNIDNENFIQRILLQFEQNQVFMLLEPLSDDHRRFMENLMEEFENAGFKSDTVLETALMQIIGTRGKFSKLEVTQGALEKMAEKSNQNPDNLIDDFYNNLRIRSLKEYNLGRSEILRMLNEIKPDVNERLENYLASFQKQKEKELDLMSQIEIWNKKIKKTLKGTREYETLKKEQENLINKLTEIQDSALKSDFEHSGSASEFEEKRKALEMQLNSLKFKLFKTNEIKDSITQKNYYENLIKIAEDELKKLKSGLYNHLTKTVRLLSKSKNPEEQNKLKKELELVLAILILERNKIQNKITELDADESQSMDGRLKILIQVKKKKLYSELEKTETKIQVVRELLDKTKTGETPDDNLSENSKLDFILFFLQYGSIPWWAETYREQSISSIFSELSLNFPEKLRQAFSRVGRNPIVWQRLINQLDETMLEKVLLTLFPNFAGFAVSTALMLEKIYESGIIGNLKNSSAKYFKWTKVSEVLFSDEGKFNPQNFVKKVIAGISREFNISPSSLLFYMVNLSENNQEGRLGIFADIIAPLTENEELQEVERELIQSAMLRKHEEEGLVIPEEKKYETLSDYLLKGVYADFTYKGGLNNPVEMEKIFWELLDKQNAATEILFEKVIENRLSRNRLSLEFSEESFWEIVRMKGIKTLPLSRKYLSDLGKALGDNRLAFAKELLLRSIYEEKDKPFVMDDFLSKLVKEASQITKRNELAIINEWKRKVYQLENVESTILLHLMQVELLQLKTKSENSDDPSEKENLLQQMQSLQLEYQQQSQQLMYLMNKEQPQLFIDFEIPEKPAELYRKIEEVKTEINKIKTKFEENPNGENLLDQILSMRQLAMLEGQLEVFELNEPAQIRQLQQLEKNLETVIAQEEKILSEIPSAKNISIPVLPEKTELEQFAELLEDDEKLNLFIKEIKPEERADWIEILKEHNKTAILREWNIPDNEQTKNLSALNLDELIKLQNEIPQGEVYRKITSRIKLLIARQLIEIQKEQRAILNKIENAESPEKAEALRKELLGFELKQNDQLDSFLNKVKDEQIKNLLLRQRNQFRLIFQRMRLLADKRKADILNERKEKQRQFIQLKKLEKEQIERKRLEFVEQIKSDKRKKEAIVKAKKEEKKKKPEKMVDEPLFIKNAGLVILHPFFNRLFTTLNLVEKNKFVSEEAQIRGVHILQYIATGKTEHPENELVLNKIICGLPLSTPVPMNVGLTEEEIRVANGLLNGAIANWPRLKTMSPDALRGTFILREGNIKEESDRWKLKVEKGSFDILLKTIPWAFTFVRSGWMPKFIMVEWPLPG